MEFSTYKESETHDRVHGGRRTELMSKLGGSNTTRNPDWKRVRTCSYGIILIIVRNSMSASTVNRVHKIHTVESITLVTEDVMLEDVKRLLHLVHREAKEMRIR